MIEVHFHAVDNLFEIFAGQVVALQYRLQCAGNRMAWPAGEQAGDLLAPPAQLGPGHRRFADLVDDIVDFATEGVQGGYGAALLLGQEQEAVIEARTTGRGLVLAVFVGSHGAVMLAGPRL